MNPPRLRSGTRQLLLPLPAPLSIASVVYEGRVTRTMSLDSFVPFLPLGFLLWGSSDLTRVLRMCTGNYSEGSGNGEAIPGRFFESGRSFEELVRLAGAGELLGEGVVPARQLLEMRELSPGMRLTVAIEGPWTAGTFWGLTYTGVRPQMRAEVKPKLGEKPAGVQIVAWTGQLIEERLTGDEIAAQAEAGTETGVIALLSLLHERPSIRI